MELADDKEPLFYKLHDKVAAGETHLSLGFFVRLSDKKNDCNCVLTKERSKAGKYPASWIISNNKSINGGDELVLYRKKVKTVKMQLDNVAL